MKNYLINETKRELKRIVNKTVLIQAEIETIEKNIDNFSQYEIANVIIEIWASLKTTAEHLQELQNEAEK